MRIILIAHISACRKSIPASPRHALPREPLWHSLVAFRCYAGGPLEGRERESIASSEVLSNHAASLDCATTGLREGKGQQNTVVAVLVRCWPPREPLCIRTLHPSWCRPQPWMLGRGSRGDIICNFITPKGFSTRKRKDSSSPNAQKFAAEGSSPVLW